jgi:hypothetical protein
VAAEEKTPDGHHDDVLLHRRPFVGDEEEESEGGALDSAGGCFGSEEYSGSGSDDGPALDLD